MGDVDLKRKIERMAMRLRTAHVPRLIAPISGTTTAAECRTALWYLANPRHLVQGPAIAEYERAFAHQIGVRYAYSFSSGRVGLYGLLHVLGVGPGDDVLVQVPTHVVVPNAIRYAGARPVYVDCRLNTFNMDLDQAERRITPRTKVLLLQHTFGIPNEMDAALALASRHGLVLIEDCAHALGASYDGRQVGSFGRAAFFSTEEKTISSTMGGMVVTDDPKLAAQVQAFQSSCAWPPTFLAVRYVLKLVLFHLITEPYVHHYTRPVYKLFRSRYIAPGATSRQEEVGARPSNYEQRLSNVQAALALGQLRRLDKNLAHRQWVANAYRTRLLESGLDLPEPPVKAEPAYVRYPICVEDREAVVRAVAPHAVLGKWWTSVIDGAAAPALSDYEKGSCPHAEAVVEHLVNLPTHLRVSARDIEAITAALMTATLGVGRL